MSKIIRKECPHDEKLDFLFNRVGRDFLRYEQMTYAYMDASCEVYDGGLWNFYSLSNEGFYLSLDHSEKLDMKWEGNGYIGTMSPDAAGVAVSLLVQNRLAWEDQSSQYADYFHALRSYAMEHPESHCIFGFID